MPFSPVTFCRPPTKHSPLQPSPRLPVHSANSRNSHIRLPVSLLLFQVRATYGIRGFPFRCPRCSTRCCPWPKLRKLLWTAVGTRRCPPVTPACPACPKNSIIPATPRAQGPLTTWGVARAPGVAVELPRSEAPSRSFPAPLPLVPFSPTAARLRCCERWALERGRTGETGARAILRVCAGHLHI